MRLRRQRLREGRTTTRFPVEIDDEFFDGSVCGMPQGLRHAMASRSFRRIAGLDGHTGHDSRARHQ